MRVNNGKIASLAEFAQKHREALSFDLITRTSYQLEDVGGALSWGALDAFIKNLGQDSALARELGMSTGWETTTKTNAILADIYDLLQLINRNLVASNSKKKISDKIKPYPRPGAEKDKRKIGTGAMPLNDLREWIKGKQRKGKQQHGKRRND